MSSSLPFFSPVLTRLGRILTVLLISALCAECGPPLTDPSHVDLSGHWVSTDQIGPVSDIEMDIIQHEDGSVEGNWSGKAITPIVCPPGLGTNPTGPVNGSNTVLEVRLALLGAGDFQGQIVDDKTLKGSFDSCQNIYEVSFSLAAVP